MARLNKMRWLLDRLGAEELTPEEGIPLRGSWRADYFIEDGYLSAYVEGCFFMWELDGFAQKWITTVLLSFSFWRK